MDARSTHAVGPAAKRRLTGLAILLFVVSGALVLVGLALVYHAAQDPWRGEGIRGVGDGDRVFYHSALGDSLPWLIPGGVALVAGTAVQVYVSTGRVRTATRTLVVGLALVVAASLLGLLRFNHEIDDLRRPKFGLSNPPP